MGSLMPGWQSGGKGAPPGFEEEEKETSRSLSLPSTRWLSRNSLTRHSTSSTTSTPPTPRSPDAFGRRFSLGSRDVKDTDIPEPVAEEEPPHNRWWSRMDSSVYNQPYEELPKDWKTGSYVPQHATVGEMHYTTKTDVDPATAGAL